MKIKHIVLFTASFFAVTQSVNSQIDMDQLGALQEFQLNQLETPKPNEESNLAMQEDNQSYPMQSDNDEPLDFGYQGRADFLIEPVSKFDDKPLTPFGYDYFENKNNPYFAKKDILVPQDYIIGPGDEVNLILYGNQNKTYSLEITREGNIFLPEIGPISIAGLTFSDAKKTISAIIDNQLIGTDVSTTLGELRSISIYLLGEANTPGMFSVPALSSITNAIFTNGGIKQTGSLRNIQLKRDGNVVTNFDLYDLLLDGDTSSDSRLMSGDVIFIPTINKAVGISGEVRRPAVFELKGSESAKDLIKYAGSFNTKADLSSIQIERIDSVSNGFSLSSFNLEDKNLSSLELKDGDKISVFPISERMDNAVLLRGHIPKPGFYPWNDRLRISDIFSKKDQLLPMTDMNYILVKRELKSEQGYEFVQINLQEVFANTDSKENIFLSNRDEITFFPSLIDVSQIRTIESDKEYLNEDTRLATHYAKKSLIEMRQNRDQRDSQSKNFTPSNQAQTSQSNQLVELKYFHYYVHDYCVIPDTLMEEIIPDLENDDENIDDENQNKDNYYQEDEENIDANLQITRHCRQQLIEPMIAQLQQQRSNTSIDNIFEVYGNVKFPGKYPLTTDSTANNGLLAAGGSSGLSYNDEIDIGRISSIGKKLAEETFSINGSDLTNFVLKPSDVITVKGFGRKLSMVKVEGEVRFPGEYPITEGETLTELIDRVGGLKEDAGTKNIFFQRRALIEKELQRFSEAQTELKKQILLASGNTFGASEESQQYLNRINLLVDQDAPDSNALGRLVLDFSAIKADSGKDIKLIDGDIIKVPKKPQSIQVLGEVNFPNTHVFDKGKDLDFYIRLSGGLNTFADSGKIYIIKQNGSVVAPSEINGFFRNTSNGIEAGDTIVVPLEINTFSGLKATTEITQIIYQMALSAAAVNSF